SLLQRQPCSTPTSPRPASASVRCRCPITISYSPNLEKVMPKTYSAAAIAVIIAVSCSMAHGQVASKGPEPATLKANAELTKTLPFASRQDFDDAVRGFIGTTPDALVTGTGPRPVWSMKPYDFLKQDDVADSVNPSLW